MFSFNTLLFGTAQLRVQSNVHIEREIRMSNSISPEIIANIDSILQEQRKFEPPEQFRRQAHIKCLADYERIYSESIEDPEKFWGRIAAELHWFKRWDKVLEW